jgi:hypothetical protein
MDHLRPLGLLALTGPGPVRGAPGAPVMKNPEAAPRSPGFPSSPAPRFPPGATPSRQKRDPRPALPSRPAIFFFTFPLISFII